MTEPGGEVELGTQTGDEFADRQIAELTAFAASASDESVDKRILEEDVRALQAAHKYRRVMVKWTLRVVGFLTFAATAFMALYIFSQWGNIDPSVMIAYFASIVAETIGILYVIARYLFPSSGPRR